MTEEERALLLLVAKFVERKLRGEIGSVAGAKNRLQEFTDALEAVNAA